MMAHGLIRLIASPLRARDVFGALLKLSGSEHAAIGPAGLA